MAYAHRQGSVALRAEDRCWCIGKKRVGGGAWVRWLTHTGREVSPSGLKTDAGASGKKRGGGAWVRWLTHTGIGTTSVRKPPDREHASLLLSPEGDT